MSAKKLQSAVILDAKYNRMGRIGAMTMHKHAWQNSCIKFKGNCVPK